MKNLRKMLLSGMVVTTLLGLNYLLTTTSIESLYAASQQAPEPQQEQEYETYTVQSGDTLAGIALAYGVSLDLLMQVNNISDANLIYVGQELRIPINVQPTETVTAPATPTETETPLPSATVTPTRTSTPNSRATKAPTATATRTPTATPTPAPAASGNEIWTAADAPIELFSPVNGSVYHSPIEIIGYSQTFEATVVIRLQDAQGNILGTRNTFGGGADGFAFFQTSLRFEVSESTAATIEVFEVSAKDGTEINTVQIPIILRPGQRVIDVERPMTGDTVCQPVLLAGYSNTFEANVNAEVVQRNGIIVLASGNATGGSLGSFAEFETTLNLVQKDTMPMLVAAYETDAQDGGKVDHTRIPVSLLTADDAQCQ